MPPVDLRCASNSKSTVLGALKGEALDYDYPSALPSRPWVGLLAPPFVFETDLGVKTPPFPAFILLRRLLVLVSSKSSESSSSGCVAYHFLAALRASTPITSQ
jgi:hypothetical protein